MKNQSAPYSQARENDNNRMRPAAIATQYSSATAKVAVVFTLPVAPIEPTPILVVQHIRASTPVALHATITIVLFVGSFQFCWRTPRGKICPTIPVAAEKFAVVLGISVTLERLPIGF